LNVEGTYAFIILVAMVLGDNHKSRGARRVARNSRHRG